ncbi:MAG TPA: hypothetical protein VK427_04550 [Kofleriaceae bacterium]|nr:hypothetical protein [Kofleriaceae bacterium]
MKWMLLLAFVFAGCIEDDKGPEDELPDDADVKADSQRKPTDHGNIAFDVKTDSALTDAERYHAWEFDLSGVADVTMATSYAVSGQRRTDTVLYLYKESASGWGSYIARNDDYGNSSYSKLVRELGAGRYRVLVKGHLAQTRGKFSIKVGCAGAGCAPAATCLFGYTYNDIWTNPALALVNKTKITPATLATLSAADQAKLVRAVQESSHTDVTTPAEALSRVDEAEINVSWLNEPLARRMFIAFEYGAGDNSYGAIFERRGDAMVSSIHDGDLYDCTVKRETCLLPEDWNALKAHPSFMRTAAKVVTSANQLNTLEAQQAVLAFRQSYDDVTTAADGLSRIDGNQLDVQTFRHSTGRDITVLAYHAGDTSVGAIFYAGTTQLAGVINDLFIESCTLFAN